MADTTFSSGTVVSSTWLNEVNDTVFSALGSGGVAPTSASTVRTNLGLGTMALKNTTDVGPLAWLSYADAISTRNALSLTAPLVNRSYSEYTTNTNLTTVIPYDDTIPQSTEGVEIISLVHSPQNANHRLRITFTGSGSMAAAGDIVVALFNGGANAIAATATNCTAADDIHQLTIIHEYAIATADAVTFSIRVGPGAAGTVRMNGTSAARRFGGVMKCALVVEEFYAT